MFAMIFRRTLYRPLMRLAHRYNWHYAPPIFPDGDTMLWCHWCGMRYVKPRLRRDALNSNHHGGPERYGNRV